MSARPSQKIVPPRSRTRPRSPAVLWQRSLTMPPSARAKMIHHPERRRDESGGGEAEMKVVGEVQRGNVVDGQLHAETGSVDDEKRPYAGIAAGRGESAVRGGSAGDFSALREVP